MIKKTYTYVDYDGNERTEDFYFNLTDAEVAELQLSVDGGLQKSAERMAQRQQSSEVIKLFRDIILKAYGEKSLDGRRFIKSAALSEEFHQTEAYNKLFMELLTDTTGESAKRFFEGVHPNTVKK